MTPPGVVRLELGALGLDRGGRLLLAHALERLGVGDVLNVIGEDPALAVHLRAWARASGHSFEPIPDGGRIRVERTGLRSSVERERAGDVDPHHPGAVAEHPPLRWGLAARGADVDVAARDFDFTLSDKTVVWSDDASRIYAQAVAAQWDPLSAIDWNAPFELPEEIEDAVVQVMTYLIENETAALIIPARFAGRIHPHFREVMQVLAIQAADEARHIEVFTRRATLRRDRLGSSSAGGQASLKTLLDEPDFALASFLLSVLGEGTFLDLLWFLHRNAPDPVTAQITKLAAQDEARHVAFGLSHLKRHAEEDPTLRARLAQAVRDRHAALSDTAGLNQSVFDALVLIAAGSWDPQAIAGGFDRVAELQRQMDEGRRQRLLRLGFSAEQAADLSGLHTRNFM